MPTFELQFPLDEIDALAARFPAGDDGRLHEVGVAVLARGYYTREEFIEVCAWKTVRSRPRSRATPKQPWSSDRPGHRNRGRIREDDGAARARRRRRADCLDAPVFAFPDHYPILDVRALESLGVKPRSQYPLSFWLGYLDACHELAQQAGVSLRTLDKALWQHSKERSRLEP